MKPALRLLSICLMTTLAAPVQAFDLWGSVKGMVGVDNSAEKPREASTPPPQDTAAATAPAALDVAPAVVDLDPAIFAEKRMWPRDDLAALNKVVVGGFRVAFVIKAVASDSVRASYMPGGIHKSGVNSKIELTLAGVDLPRMQALVDRAYQDFLTQLQGKGVDTLPYAAFAAHPSFAEISAAKQEDGKPYTVEHEGRTYIVLAPTGMKLWFDQAEPLGDQGAFGWTNGRRAADFGFDNKALILNPLMVVDFAETASGRNKGLFGVRNESDVEARAGMSLRKNLSVLQVRGRVAPISSAIMGGTVALKEQVMFSGRFGQLSMGEVDSNRGLVVGLALLGLSGGPVRTNQKGVMLADAGRYEEYAGNLLLSGNRLFARVMGELYN